MLPYENIDRNKRLLYNNCIITEGGNIMTASDMIKDLILRSGMLKKDVAEAMGWKYAQHLTNRLGRNTVSADEFLKIVDICGYAIKIEKKDDNQAVEVRPFVRGVGEHLKMMVDKVKYDTHNADAICHTDETKPTFIEVYKKLDGSYFVAQYVNWEGGKSSISPIGEEDALRLIDEITL